MFKPLGLFGISACPDPSCCRPRCLFNHGETSKSSSTQVDKSVSLKPGSKAPTVAQLHLKREVGVASSARKEVEVAASVRQPVTKRLRTEDSQTTTSIKTSDPPTTKPNSPPPAPIPGGITKSPSLPTNLRNSPQPWVDRQKGLQTLFTQFAKLYSTILPTPSGLAQISALEQEREISTSSANLKAYKSAIHHAAVSISRRPKPNRVTHSSVGTMRESRAAVEEAAKRQASRLTRDRVERYCLPLSDFPTWRYPDPTDASLIVGGGEDPSAEGTTQTCSRCKNPFVVSSDNLEGRFGECKFHYGRTAPERIEGRRKWIYSCCGRERGEAGCEEGVHVFTDEEEDKALARRIGFRKVKQCREGLPKDGMDVVGMDCEMICLS